MKGDNIIKNTIAINLTTEDAEWLRSLLVNHVSELDETDELNAEGIRSDIDTAHSIMDEIDEACDDERDSRFPDAYCEIEYADMDSEEAVRGCAFDDMNYLRYFER